jgi:hypothetical protein
LDFPSRNSCRYTFPIVRFVASLRGRSIPSILVVTGTTGTMPNLDFEAPLSFSADFEILPVNFVLRRPEG